MIYDPAITPELSIVSPVYRAVDCLEELYHRLTKTLESLSVEYEIILVEDGGADGSWEVVKSLAERDARVRGYQLSRNFGQHHAIAAGVHVARGSWIVVMDCDLQDPPEAIPDLYHTAHEGYDVVLGRRIRRQDRLMKRATSGAFYWLFNKLTGLKYDGSVANFSVISRKVAEELKGMTEAVRFYGAFLTWMGFEKAYVDIPMSRRHAGESSYTFGRLIRLAFPIVLAYSSKPLRLIVYAGVVIPLLSFSAAAWIVVGYYLNGSPIMGWSSLMVSGFFGLGIVVMVLGVIGLYLDRVFVEVKRRPIFIIREATNEE